MSFQKCPICLGTGDDPFVLELPRSTWPCPTCKGTRIISELTGLPPAVEEKHNIFELGDPCMADAQSFFSCTKIDTRPKYNHSSDQSTQNPTQDVSNIQSRESQV